MQESIIALSKMLGGLSGSLIALSILKPKSIYDAISRLIVSVILAYYLTSPLGFYVFDKPNQEVLMAVSMLIGIFGWFIVSISLHTVASAKSLKDLKEKLK